MEATDYATAEGGRAGLEEEGVLVNRVFVRRTVLFFTGLPLFFLVLVTIYPLLFSLIISFKDLSLLNLRESNFIGLGNYVAALTSSATISAFGHSLYFTVFSVSVEIVVALAAAMILNQKFHGRGFVRALLILPWALPDVVNSVMWKWILNADHGALNGVLYQLHLIQDYQAWLASGPRALNLLILSNIWRCAPFVTILLLAGLQSISEEVLEAARVDGTSSWQRFWYIILPMLKPIIFVALVLRTMDALRVFGLIYIVTSGGPGGATITIGYHIFEQAFNALQLGYASAMAWLLFLFVMGLAVLYFHLLREKGRSDS